MSYQAQVWVDEAGVDLCRNGGEAFVLVRIANHTGPDMRGCFASAATLARLCKMGRSTVLKHLRELLARRVILPGDPALTDHLPADKRPPVYDLAGGHKPGCTGGHSIAQQCSPAAGARFEHPPKRPTRAGTQSEHPPKKPSSAGACSEHPKPSTGGAGVQIETERVFKSSTNSSKEVKLPLSVPPGGLNAQPSQPPGPSQDVEERENTAAPEGSPADATGVPEQRQEQKAPRGDSQSPRTEQHSEETAFVAGLPGAIRLGRTDRSTLAALAAAKVADGWTLAQLAEVCSWRTPGGPDAPAHVYGKRLRELADPPTAPPPARRCITHPRRIAEYGGLCVECHGSQQAAAPQMSAEELAVGAAFRQQRRNRAPVGA